ncbi:MAG: dienelactone hydrolase family protein, partial [Alphaproteobacteria bacterium]
MGLCYVEREVGCQPEGAAAWCKPAEIERLCMETVKLRTTRGTEFVGHIAVPAEGARGALVVLHEAFGVTPHIKRVCKDYADQGYAVIAPAMLSLALGKPEGAVLPQTKNGLDEARRLIEATDHEDLLGLVQACVDWGRAQGLKVATVGFCWGGSVSYKAASLLENIDACVCYYGGQIHELCKVAQPKCATLVHLAELDRYIPIEAATANLAAFDTAAKVHVYEADHGFNRDDGVTYDPGAALVAR